jgi:hypothetical protein
MTTNKHLEDNKICPPAASGGQKNADHQSWKTLHILISACFGKRLHFSIFRSAGIFGGRLETPEISCLFEDLMISKKISWVFSRSAEIFENQLNLWISDGFLESYGISSDQLLFLKISWSPSRSLEIPCDILGSIQIIADLSRTTLQMLENLRSG